MDPANFDLLDWDDGIDLSERVTLLHEKEVQRHSEFLGKLAAETIKSVNQMLAGRVVM